MRAWLFTILRMVKTMLTCHWCGLRIQRHLDADPPPRQQPAKVRRLESHPDECDKRNSSVEDCRQLSTALSQWAARRLPDRQSLARPHGVFDRIVDGDLQ